MKVGDLVRFKNRTAVRGNVFLVMRTEVEGFDQKVWIILIPILMNTTTPMMTTITMIISLR